MTSDATRILRALPSGRYFAVTTKVQSVVQELRLQLVMREVAG